MTVQAETSVRVRRDGAISQREERQRGLAFARAWRERMRAEFDARFGKEPTCAACGQPIGACQ